MAKKIMAKRRNKFILTQHEEMADQVSRLIVLSAFLFAAYIAVMFIKYETNLPFQEGFWSLSLVLTIWAFIFWGFSLAATRFINRAFHFHLLMFLSAFFFTSTSLFFLLWFVQSALGAYGWIINSVIIISLVIGYADEFFRNKNQLHNFRDSLVKSGRLNQKNGWWNVKVPIEFLSDNKRAKSKILIAVIIVQLITFIVTIAIGPFFDRTVGYLWLIVFAFPFRKIGGPAALFVQLYLWEMDLGLPIIIAPDEQD